MLIFKSIFLIDSNENGFEKMQNVLQGQSDVDAVHIIGHASAGQVVLGNSILNADTINSFSNTLQSIGNSLTQDGDMNPAKVPIQELTSNGGNNKIASLINEYSLSMKKKVSFSIVRTILEKE